MPWIEDSDRPALILDGLSVFHSVAGPAAQLTNGYTYSFVIQLTSAVKKFRPKGIFVCWDSHSTYRTSILPEYKAHRQSSMNEVKEKYLLDVKRFLKVTGVDQLSADGFEADDIGAFLANTLEKAVLVSNDKDWLQLVRPGVSVYYRCHRQGGKAEKKEITTKNFAELTAYSSPENLVRFLCAAGDGVDNIKGLYGVSEATVNAYLLGLRGGMSGGQRKKLDDFFAGHPDYIRNKKLIELRDITSIPGLVANLGEFDEEAVKSLLEEFGFASMLKNFPAWIAPYKEASVGVAEV